MRKLILGIASAGATTLSAQVDLSSTRFGIAAAGNYSRVNNGHNPSGPRYTLQAGFLALVPLDNSYQFYLQPELVYYGAGETGKNKDSKGKSGYDAVYSNDYISVPVYFKGYFSEAESEFFGLIGPRFSFLVNQKVKDAPAGREYYDPNFSDPDYPEINGKANKFNFGIGVGLGFSYKRKLELNLRYDIGLSNTYPNLVEDWTGDPDAEKKKSEQVLSLGLNYIFD